MGLITVAFILAEAVLFAYVVRWQITNKRNSEDALGEIDRVLKRDKFDLQNNTTASSVIINQFDRMIEFPLEKIRSFSNGALVAGIGGTMGLFFLEASSIGLSLAFSGGTKLPWLWTIFFGLLLALLSSIIGVWKHLRITSDILSAAHDKVSSKESELVDFQTQGHAQETDLSQQLKELTEAWNDADALDLFEMIPEFLQGQTAVMDEMQRRFGKQQFMVSDVLKSQRGATQKLDEVLVGLNSHSKAQHEFATKIQESQQNLLKRVNDSLIRLIDERESLTKEIELLPDKIRKSIDADKIGEIFGRQAMNYVSGLEDAFQKAVFRFGESLKSNQKHLVNRIVDENQTVIKSLSEFTESLKSSQKGQFSRLVVENSKIIDSLSEFTESLKSSQKDQFSRLVVENSGIINSLSEFTDSLEDSQTDQINKFISENQRIVDSFGELRDKMEEHIVKPLGGIAVQLDETAETMPNAAQQFGDNLLEATKVLSRIPKELQEVGTNINEVVGSTTAEALIPLFEKMNRYIETVQHTHESLEKIIHGLVDLIRDMVKEIEREK